MAHFLQSHPLDLINLHAPGSNQIKVQNNKHREPKEAKMPVSLHPMPVQVTNSLSA